MKISLVHIMSILTDLYSDPELAIIREYATNAYDSHVEAGVERPIEVTLPTALAPFFKVRDFGIGLSAEEIHTIYSKYGASTKRETNEQTGMLGLGCKSALTYIDQFTLIAIKDNIRSTVNIGRNENGSGSLTVVESTPTIESPGVEIIIPVSNKYSEFETKARGFFRFWQSGVLVNGQVPDCISNQFKVTDSLYLNDLDGDGFWRTSSGKRSIVVMGNVPYPVNDIKQIVPDCPVIAYVPVGAVNFTPSRESLQYTKKTNEILSKLGLEFDQNIGQAIQGSIDQCNSKSEALGVFIKWKNKIPSSYWDKEIFSYEGTPIIRTLNTTNRSLWVVSNVNHSHVSKMRTIDVSLIPGSIVVTGYHPQTFTTIHRKKLKRWADENGIRPKSFILCKEDIDLEWVDPAYVVDWSFARTIRLSQQLKTTTPDLSYDGFQDGKFQYNILADGINTKNLYHCIGRKDDTKRYYSLTNSLVEGDIMLITLPSTRVNKYQRFFPTSKDAKSEIKALWDQWRASLSDQVKYAIQVQSSGGNYYFTSSELDPSEIHDPELKAYLEAHDLNIENVLEKYLKFNQVGFHFARHMVDFGKRYPMINGRCTHIPEHAYIYINAVYEKAKE